jgi:hypothetical protein
LIDLAAAMMGERRAEHFLDGGHGGSYSQSSRPKTIANPSGVA